MALSKNVQSTGIPPEMLEHLLELFPVALTVRAADGRLIMANREAAGSPGLALGEAAHRRSKDERPADRKPFPDPQPQRAGPGEELVCIEETMPGSSPERTLLTTYRSARIGNESLLLSASIDITEQKRVERELARRALVDDLTGLGNRTHLQQHLEEAIRRRGRLSQFALAFIDLDNFKHVNDYYGHAVGDALLAKIAQRVSAQIRRSDMFARISGDEFVLVIDPFESTEQLQAMIDRLLEEFTQPFHVERFEVFTSASIGVSIYPDHGESYEELRRNADNAMYRAKNGAKGSAVMFDGEMGRHVTARIEMEQKLRLAIRDCQFCCAFQPKVDLVSNEVVGFEALLRFRDADGLIHAPGNFITLAIELGLIDPITHFALTEADNALDQLDALFGGGKTVSINVAARQAGNLKFMRPFVEALNATRRPDRFMIEITEDALVPASKFQSEVLPLLRQIGVRISIDDFGTGFSSLACLADITADEVKIDRSLISEIHRRPRNQGVLRAIESLGDALGAKLVAEGIETAEELEYLTAATHIRCVQGFYFCKPFFLEEVASTNHVPRNGRILESTRKSVPRTRIGR